MFSCTQVVLRLFLLRDKLPPVVRGPLLFPAECKTPEAFPHQSHFPRKDGPLKRKLRTQHRENVDCFQTEDRQKLRLQYQGLVGIRATLLLITITNCRRLFKPEQYEGSGIDKMLLDMERL